MNEMRHVKYFLAALMIASLATFGCSKDKESSASGGKASADATAAFALFAKDSNMVVGINMTQLTSSDIYKKFKPMLDQQIEQAGDDFKDFKAKCGIDPMKDFKSMIIGGKAGADMEPDEKTMLVVVKGPERPKMVECGKKMSEEKGGTVAEEGNFTKVTKKDGEVQWIGWLDNNTMVVAPKMDKAGLEARMAGKDGLSGNKEMMDLLGNTDQTASLWFAMAPDGGIKPPAGGMPMPAMDFKAAFGSISTKSGVKIDVGARTGSADSASKLKKELQGKIKEIKPMADMMGAGKYVDKLKLSSNGPDLLAKMSLSMKDIEELQKLAGKGMGM